jgi:NFACT protein RNA binding domain
LKYFERKDSLTFFTLLVARFPPLIFLGHRGKVEEQCSCTRSPARRTDATNERVHKMVFYFRTRCGNYLLYMGKDKYENEDLIKYGQVRHHLCVCATFRDRLVS